MFFLAEVYSISQMFVAGYFIRGARRGPAPPPAHPRTPSPQPRLMAAADASTWTAARDSRPHDDRLPRAVGGLHACPEHGHVSRAVLSFEGPTKFTICCALTTGGARHGRASARSQAATFARGVLTQASARVLEPLAESGMTRGHGLTPREATPDHRTARWRVRRAPCVICPVRCRRATTANTVSKAKVELTDRNLEAHNKRLNPDLIISDPTPREHPRA